MFDSLFAAASDAELLAAIEDGVRQEAIAGARRFAAIAELTRRVEDCDERAYWAFDPWDSAAAEVAAAMAIGSRRASGQMRIAQALREHLPQVAALYGEGALSTRLVSTITWGTRLVQGEAAWANIDSAIAQRALTWERLSEDKLRAAVDMQVSRYDPDAHRRTDTAVRGRDFVIGACDDDTDTVAVWGRLLAPDAAVMQQRITAMVAGLCDTDPRSAGERRSDATAAIANGITTLACRCGSPSCPAAGVTPKSNVVIRVITDQTAIDDAMAAVNSPTVDQAETAVDQPATATVKSKPRPPAPALLLGYGSLPNAVLAETIRTGAVIKAITLPGAEPEPRYRPSAELAEFVRLRDWFCRFPGCDVPADLCDLDHARPWPFGPTHPSNLNCKCRKHHLMKTFWTGIGGWADRQLPDGTLIWTAPSGRTYTTQPGSRLFYPTWDVTTAELPPPTHHPTPDTLERALKMPRRKRPRSADLAAAIQAERKLNQRDRRPPF